MRKRITLTAILGIVLAAILTGAAVIAQTPTPTAQPNPVTKNVVTSGNGANVNIEVPNGTINHPLKLRIIVMAVDENSDYGGPSVMNVYIWVPSANQYVGVAILSTNTNQSGINWIHQVVNGTPIWSPPTLQNYFVPTDNQFTVYMDGDILWANLTTSYNVTLPAALGGNFTLPPMTLMFVPIGEGFAHQELSTLPKPAYSGWSIQSTHTDVPSWVRVSIPAWSPNAPIETVGTMTTDSTTIYIPPTS